MAFDRGRAAAAGASLHPSCTAVWSASWHLDCRELRKWTELSLTLPSSLQEPHHIARGWTTGEKKIMKKERYHHKREKPRKAGDDGEKKKNRSEKCRAGEWGRDRGKRERDKEGRTGETTWQEVWSDSETLVGMIEVHLRMYVRELCVNVHECASTKQSLTFKPL